AEAVRKPKKCNETKENESEKMHWELVSALTSGYANTDGKQPRHHWGRARRARPGPPLARTRVESGRGGDTGRGERTAGRPLHRPGEITREHDATDSAVARDSGLDPRRRDQPHGAGTGAHRSGRAPRKSGVAHLRSPRFSSARTRAGLWCGDRFDSSIAILQ